MGRVIGLALIFCFTLAAQPAATPPPNPALTEMPDEPGLPRVLLIGDSISIGYTIPVRELLKGKANVHRILTNGADTKNGLAHVTEWLGTGKWDLIHFNWGLHDLKVDADGNRQVPLEQYQQNLRELVGKLNRSGARLIFATTTPVPESAKLNPRRVSADVISYNLAGRKVMEESGVPIDDLYEVALPKLKEIQLPDNVHYTPEGYSVLGARVASVILKELGR